MCGAFNERFGPRRLEVNGIGQHHSGIPRQCLFGDKILNARFGLLLHPGIDVYAFRFGVFGKIPQLQGGTVTCARQLEERLFEGESGLPKQAICDRQLVKAIRLLPAG